MGVYSAHVRMLKWKMQNCFGCKIVVVREKIDNCRPQISLNEKDSEKPSMKLTFWPLCIASFCSILTRNPWQPENSHLLFTQLFLRTVSLKTWLDIKLKIGMDFSIHSLENRGYFETLWTVWWNGSSFH